MSGSFLSFLPAVSTKAAGKIRGTIRSWQIHRRTRESISELAAKINPVLRGWVNYYGHYYRSKLGSVLNQLDYAVVRWAKNKYKRLKRSATRARSWVKRVAKDKPRLLAHWRIKIPE